jgi:hypothetical protein
MVRPDSGMPGYVRDRSREDRRQLHGPRERGLVGHRPLMSAQLHDVWVGNAVEASPPPAIRARRLLTLFFSVQDLVLSETSLKLTN